MQIYPQIKMEIGISISKLYKNANGMEHPVTGKEKIRRN